MATVIRTPVMGLRRAVSKGRAALRTVRECLRLWRRRLRTRHALAQLDAARLRDVGITHTQARREAEKPFWKA